MQTSYDSLIRPVLENASSAWIFCNQKDVKEFEKQQNQREGSPQLEYVSLEQTRRESDLGDVSGLNRLNPDQSIYRLSEREWETIV